MMADEPPAAASGGGSAAADEPRVAAASPAPLVVVDPGVLRFMLSMLTGPLPSFKIRYRAELWASSVAVLGISTAVMIKTFNTQLTDSSTLWRSIGWFGASLLVAAGVLASNTIYMMSLSLQAAAAPANGGEQGLGGQLMPVGEGGPAADRPREGNQAGRFLQTLLVSMKISPEAASKMRARKRRSIAFAVAPTLAFLVILCGMFAVFLDGPLDGPKNATSDGVEDPFSSWTETEETVLFWVGLLFLLPSGAGYCGWRMFMEIPIIVSTDLINQASKQVRALAGAARSASQYNEAMGSIQAAHEITVRLSALLAPTLLANMGVWAVFGILWATAAFAPRGSLPPDSMVNTLFPPWALLLSTNLALLLALWPLIEAAEISSACDELLEATVVLRQDAPGDPEIGKRRSGKAGRCLLVSPDHLVRLHGLQRYARELNRNQGFGFTLRKQRISEKMIMRIIIRGVSLNVSLLSGIAAFNAYH